MTGEVDDEAERWQRAVRRANKPEVMDNIWDDYGHITKKRS
jgi:hypothetical protein